MDIYEIIFRLIVQVPFITTFITYKTTDMIFDGDKKRHKKHLIFMQQMGN